jgi:hypothetical protein
VLGSPFFKTPHVHKAGVEVDLIPPNAGCSRHRRRRIRAYRKISDRIGKRRVKPVLPLPLTPDEKAHNARVTASSSVGDK